MVRLTDPWNLEFPGLKDVAAAAPGFRQLKICIATQDIVGPVRNGGIGTAYYYVARSLAAAGHDVTILYALGERCQNGTIADWVAWYGDMGIAFVPMPEPVTPVGEGPLGGNVRFALGVYDWLKERSFDIVHVSEWRGLGYYAVLAKHLGIAFADTRFIVKTSSPTVWNKLGNAEPLEQPSELIVSHMERRSVELADVVVSGSQYMLRWMASQGYVLPEGRCFAQPNIVPVEERTAPAVPERRARVREIVFFGRLEPRKGLIPFCAAVARLGQWMRDAPANARPRIVFLGKEPEKSQAKRYIAEQAEPWPFDYQVVDDLDQTRALAFLKEGDRLAVLCPTSDNSPFGVYECLLEGIPFVASNVGGIPELVAETHHPATLFDLHPEALANRLHDVWTNGATVAAPRYDFAENERVWRDFHLALANGTPADPRAAERAPALPSVSVCITGGEDVASTLASLEGQACDIRDVVLVELPSLADRDGEVGTGADLRVGGVEAVHEVADGIGAARNAGARRSGGEYVLFLDAGTTLGPEALQTMLRVAKRHHLDIIGAFAALSEPSNGKGEDAGSGVRQVLLGDSLAFGLFHNGLVGRNLLVRRAVWEALGGFVEDAEMHQSEWEFAVRALLGGYTLAIVPEPLYRAPDIAEPETIAYFSWQPDRFRVLEAFFESTPEVVHPLLLVAQGVDLRAERLRAGNETLRERVADSNRRRGQMERDFGKARRDLTDTERRLAATERQLAQSQEAQEAMRQSWSWRVTAPLRWFKRDET